MARLARPDPGDAAGGALAEEWLAVAAHQGRRDPASPAQFCKSKLGQVRPGYLAAACVAEAERAARRGRGRPPRPEGRRGDRRAAAPSPRPVLAGFERRKQRAGLLDYDDLITRTSGLLLDPGHGLGAVQAGWRAGPPAAGRGAGHRAGAMGDRRRAHRRVLRAGGDGGRAHGVRGGRPQAVDLLLPGRRPGWVRPVARTDAPGASGRQAAGSATPCWTCRSAPPPRCWTLVDAVFAEPACRRGRGGRWRGALAARSGPRRASRPGGIVAPGAACRHTSRRSLGRWPTATTG